MLQLEHGWCSFPPSTVCHGTGRKTFATFISGGFDITNKLLDGQESSHSAPLSTSKMKKVCERLIKHRH